MGYREESARYGDDWRERTSVEQEYKRGQEYRALALELVALLREAPCDHDYDPIIDECEVRHWMPHKADSPGLLATCWRCRRDALLAGDDVKALEKK